MTVSRRCVWKCIESGDRYVYMSVNTISPAPQRHHPGHHQLGQLVSFAAAVTVGAAVLAWLLASVARLPEAAVVITVMSIAFAASWTVTNHRPAPTHRVTTVRARVHSH